MSDVLQTAQVYAQRGFSLAPIRLDGTKKPVGKWAQLQKRQPTGAELSNWFNINPFGIALIHGAVSGNSEVLDFDSAEAYEEFAQLCIEYGYENLLLLRLTHVQTPSGGRHLYYRHTGAPEGNQKLAREASGETKSETRGEGGYSIAPGSPIECHPDHKPYVLLSGIIGGFSPITADERAVLLAFARAGNKYADSVVYHAPKYPAGRPPLGDKATNRLGDDFNERGDSLALLLKWGWQIAGERSGEHGPVLDLTRPGKSAHDGTSATFNYVGPNALYVFSSSAVPFEPERAYKPFSVYGLLEHSGDFSEAARQLAHDGYGDPVTPSVRMAISKYEKPAPETLSDYLDDDDIFDAVLPESVPTSDTNPATCALTDLGNAHRLIARHGHDLHYSSGWGWLAWNRKYWEVDESGENVRRMKNTSLRIMEEAAELARAATKEEDDEKRVKLTAAAEAHVKWAKKSQMAKGIMDALKLAQTEPGVYVGGDKLDTPAMLLNCQNGTLDLATGELRQFKRADLLTKTTLAHFDKNAQCPQWEKFIGRILPDDDVRAYVQRAAGYTLTGDVSEQCLFFLYGSGSNGKSTFLQILLYLMGGYGKQASPELLVAKKGEMIRDDVAGLAGKRLAATIETDEGRAMAEALMKQLTGGDRITARFLYKNSFEFDPTFKIWLAANHKPVVKNNDYGVWRRIKLVAFTEKIGEDEKDPHLLDKLKAELPGILNWALAGLAAWRANGLGEPQAVKEASDEYRQESDLIGQFLEEMTVAKEGVKIKPSDLYASYVTWCEDRRERPKTLMAFSRSLSEREIERVTIKGSTFYKGFCLLSDREEPETGMFGAGGGAFDGQGGAFEPVSKTSYSNSSKGEFPKQGAMPHPNTKCPTPIQQKEKEENTKKQTGLEIVEGEID